MDDRVYQALQNLCLYLRCKQRKQLCDLYRHATDLNDFVQMHKIIKRLTTLLSRWHVRKNEKLRIMMVNSFLRAADPKVQQKQELLSYNMNIQQQNIDTLNRHYNKMMADYNNRRGGLRQKAEDHKQVMKRMMQQGPSTHVDREKCLKPKLEPRIMSLTDATTMLLSCPRCYCHRRDLSFGKTGKTIAIQTKKICSRLRNLQGLEAKKSTDGENEARMTELNFQIELENSALQQEIRAVMDLQKTDFQMKVQKVLTNLVHETNVRLSSSGDLNQIRVDTEKLPGSISTLFTDFQKAVLCAQPNKNDNIYTSSYDVPAMFTNALRKIVECSRKTQSKAMACDCTAMLKSVSSQ